MKVVETTPELDAALMNYRGKDGLIGFVPTMGALHPGHLSLPERAKSECIVTVASIFVNPTQFNDPKDLEKYPRTLEADLVMLREAGCDLVFVPSVSDVYPEGLEKDRIEIDFGMLEKVMEGKSRPGHFKGMATVVNKLFQKVKPQRAYFGKKDYQQLAIIKEMERRLAADGRRPPVEIVECGTIREADGLAMSSRNRRLSPEQRSKAKKIAAALFWIKENANSLVVDELLVKAKEQLSQEKLLELDYLEIVDRNTLQSLPPDHKPVNAVACIAVKIGDIRLIDNMEI